MSVHLTRPVIYLFIFRVSVTSHGESQSAVTAPHPALLVCGWTAQWLREPASLGKALTILLPLHPPCLPHPTPGIIRVPCSLSMPQRLRRGRS